MWVVTSIILVLGAGALWEAIAGAVAKRRYPPPGKLIEVKGRRLHLHCTGSGAGPTVVIESGRMNTSTMWALVQDEVSRFARICTYDRAGYAWSDPDDRPRTGERVAADLHALLHKAEIPGPYLLVGHSYGAFFVRYFARMYPDEVAGLILVDPYTEGEVRGDPKMTAMQLRFNRMMMRLTRFGIPRLMAPFMTGITSQLSRFPAHQKSAILSFSTSFQIWRAIVAEWQDLEGLSERVGGPGSLGELPLLILSAGRCDLKPGGGLTQADVDSLWRLQQGAKAELVRLSARSRLEILPDTGHGVPVERPEAIVEAIRAHLS